MAQLRLLQNARSLDLQSPAVSSVAFLDHLLVRLTDKNGLQADGSICGSVHVHHQVLGVVLLSVIHQVCLQITEKVISKNFVVFNRLTIGVLKFAYAK